ncbi:hypothetical protein LX36DRAFT_674555 [Colletotrichum falcatum]|nr:hypothetical protein LX36DRAFT_674555 [Colletotrichum falcatum]
MSEQGPASVNFCLPLEPGLRHVWLHVAVFVRLPVPGLKRQFGKPGRYSTASSPKLLRSWYHVTASSGMAAHGILDAILAAATLTLRATAVLFTRSYGGGATCYAFRRGDVVFFVLDTRRYRSLPSPWKTAPGRPCWAPPSSPTCGIGQRPKGPGRLSFRRQVEETDVSVYSHPWGNSKSGKVSFDTTEPNRLRVEYDLVVDGSKVWNYPWEYQR